MDKILASSGSCFCHSIGSSNEVYGNENVDIDDDAGNRDGTTTDDDDEPSTTAMLPSSSSVAVAVDCCFRFCRRFGIQLRSIKKLLSLSLPLSLLSSSFALIVFDGVRYAKN